MKTEFKISDILNAVDAISKINKNDKKKIDLKKHYKKNENLLVLNQAIDKNGKIFSLDK